MYAEAEGAVAAILATGKVVAPVDVNVRRDRVREVAQGAGGYHSALSRPATPRSNESKLVSDYRVYARHFV